MTDKNRDRITEILKGFSGTVVRRQDIMGRNRDDSFFVYFDGYKSDEINAAKRAAVKAIVAEFPDRDFGIYNRKSRGYTSWNLCDDSGWTGERRVGFEIRDKVQS